MAAAVKPGSRRWKELVSQGIIKDGERNWFLGDAALEIAPMGDEGAHNGAYENLQKYADEIGVVFASIREYRRVASVWPPDTRVSGTGWKVHSQLTGHRELIKSRMTVTQAAAALGHSNVGRTGPRADVTDKAAAVKEYLSDPEVAKAALSDPDTASDAVRAARPELGRAVAEHDDRVRDQVERGPHGKSRDQAQTRIEVMTVLQRLAEVRISVSRLAGLGTITPLEMEMLADEGKQTLASVQWLAELTPDQADLSGQVTAFLRSQS